MSRLGMSMAVMAAAALMGGMGGSDIRESYQATPRPQPKQKKTSGNPAGSKYKNRKKRNKPLFRV